MRLHTLAVILGSLGVAACASDRAPSVHTVEIRDLAFVPDTVRATPGDTIVWINRDIVPHTATAGSAWDSGPIDAGAEFRMVVPDDVGAEYVCAYHPMMRGVVQRASGS